MDVEPAEITGDHALLISLANREFHDTGSITVQLRHVAPDHDLPVGHPWQWAPPMTVTMAVVSLEAEARDWLRAHRGEYLSIEIWQDSPNGRLHWHFPKFQPETGELLSDPADALGPMYSVGPAA